LKSTILKKILERQVMVDGIFYAKAAACIGASICMGIGVVGPALGQGFIGMKACENIGKYPESAGKIRTAMFLSMGIVETGLLWAGLVSGGLLYLAYSFA
jgi:F-type H+-transporting ATPase subunit c